MERESRALVEWLALQAVLADSGEALGFEACTADQGPVDVALAHELKD